jgi:hypothetical protein
MVTTAKLIRVEKPQFDSEGAINNWTEEAVWGFTTTEERAAIMPDARTAAKACGGRVVLVTTTTDDKDSADETTWYVTVATKVLVSRVVASATVTAPKDQWARALPLLQGAQGCKALTDAITAAIA